jgi:hypothetical protein
VCAVGQNARPLAYTHSPSLDFSLRPSRCSTWPCELAPDFLVVLARVSLLSHRSVHDQEQTRRTNQAALFTRRVTSHNAMLRAHPRAQTIAQRSRLVSREHVTERRVEIKRRSREGRQWLARRRCGVVGQSDEGTNTAAIGRNSDVSHIDGGHEPEKSLLRRVRCSSTKQPN